MTNVLIRDVPGADLDELRSEAAAQGVSLQAYLLETVRAQARFIRRREALNRVEQRLAGNPEVPEVERRAVLDAIDEEQDSRAAELGDRVGR